MKATRSLTRRVLGTVLLLELVSATVLIAASVAYEWQSRVNAFDVMLRGRADTLLGAVGDADDQADDVMLDMTGLAISPKDIYLVRDDKSGVLGQSKTPIPAGILTQASGSNEAVAVRIHGRHYRIIRVVGTRIVDPGDAGGGVRHTITVFYSSGTNHIWHDVIDAVRFYAIATILLFSITTIVMVWLLRRDLAPLHQLATEAGKVSTKNWAFQTPQAAKNTKELLPLAQAIESVLARLQRSFEQQRRLTSDAAHELKTDVAIVKSSLQLLAMRSRTTSEYQQGLELCLDDCSRLERTVQQMLTLARVEHVESVPGSGRKSDRCSLRAIIEQSNRQMKSFAELRRVKISFSAGADALVDMDEGDCTHLFSNLLLNALQHSPADTTVNIRMTAANGQAQVTIQDQGEGIAPDDLPHIFEPFYRGDPSRSRESGGTGLGLAICKAICERSEGAIQITNAPNGGAEVNIQLPVAE
jgi:signal transduction histidine kinase